ncbi:MAG: hypothetical protein EA357_09525 [Micavibrio sp.]|nr:MAG: hypothetical protein EA357_09525 [Micavibrio sp.]
MKNRKGNPLDRWESTPANKGPNWLPAPTSADIELFQTSTLEEAMRKKRLLCIYWFLQDGQTPQQDGFTDFITKTIAQDQDARFLRVFIDADQSRTVQKKTDEIFYAVADHYLQMELYNGRSRYHGAVAAQALFHILGDDEADLDTISAFSKGDGAALQKIAAESNTNTLTLLFQIAPQRDAEAILAALHEKAMERGNLPMMQWLESNKLHPVSENDIFRATERQIAALTTIRNSTEHHTKNTAVKNWIKNATPETLLLQNGKILQTAIESGQHDIVATLLEKTHDWPQGIIEAGMRQAFAQDKRDMLMRLGSLKTEWQAGLLKEFEKDTSPDKRNIQQSVYYLKKSYLEDGWSVVNKNEISRSVSTGNASISHLFNFRSKTVTTTAVPSGGRGAALQVTNFREFQSGDEIDDAYWRLRIFHDDAPPYKGKDDGARHRTVHRTRPGRTGGTPHA